MEADTFVEHLTPDSWSKVELTIERALALQKILMFAIFVTVHTTLAVAMMR